MDIVGDRDVEVSRAMGDLVKPVVLQRWLASELDCSVLLEYWGFISIKVRDDDAADCGGRDDSDEIPSRPPENRADDDQTIDRGEEEDSAAKVGRSAGEPAVGWGVGVRRDRWR